MKSSAALGIGEIFSGAFGNGRRRRLWRSRELKCATILRDAVCIGLGQTICRRG
jgi:hypothetical protein